MYEKLWACILGIGGLGTVKVIQESASGVASGHADSTLQLGIGIASAILILREVFAFLRATAETRRDDMQREIRDLLWKLNERLKDHDKD